MWHWARFMIAVKFVVRSISGSIRVSSEGGTDGWGPFAWDLLALRAVTKRCAVREPQFWEGCPVAGWGCVRTEEGEVGQGKAARVQLESTGPARPWLAESAGLVDWKSLSPTQEP